MSHTPSSTAIGLSEGFLNPFSLCKAQDWYMCNSENVICCCDANCQTQAALWDGALRREALPRAPPAHSSGWRHLPGSYLQTTKSLPCANTGFCALIQESWFFWGGVEMQHLLLLNLVLISRYAAKLYNAGRRTIQLFNLHRLVSAGTPIPDFLD